MKHVFVLAFATFAAGCASTGQETMPASAPSPAAAAQVQPSAHPLAMYVGTYELQGERGALDVRVWLEDGMLHGELVASGRRTAFRPTAEPHKFLHESSDQVSFVFTVEDGRATALTMRQGTREARGPRK
jgi:hypothetical protein